MVRRNLWGKVAALVCATVALAVLASIGADGTSRSAAAAGLAPVAGAGPTARTADIAPERKRPRPGRTRVVQAGPASPISPTIDRYFYALQHRQCAELRADLEQQAAQGPLDPAGELFSALADLCLGARFASHSSDWAAAQRAYDASGVLTDCLSVAGRAGLRRALDNFAASGSRRPDFRPAVTGTACTPDPTFVGLLQDSPDGPATLIVLGLRLFEASAVRVNGIWLPARSSNAIGGTECARVDVSGSVAPASGESVSVRVRGNSYATALRQWTVGQAVTEEELQNIDSDLCAPTSTTIP